jgi:hypothetical protein
MEFNRKLTLYVSLLSLIAALLAMTPQSAWGQQVTAAIIGTVTDPTGAPMAEASVTAKDLDRGVVWPTTSNGEGVYNLPRLPVGAYEVRVEAKGFQTSVLPRVELEMNQTARADFQMKLGQVSEAVEVTGAAPLLQTETTQYNTVIDSRTNEALPLATRNYIQLTLLAPGSVNPDPKSMANGQNTANGGRPYVNGNREQANNFLLDGLDNNQVSDNLVGYAPSVDAIQEFNMITQNASAEFGNFQGGIISTSTKSGTNHLHGTLFEFFRNDKLNANSWSNNFTDAPRNKVRWNMFGGSIGGPIIKDKLFFFGDYQGERFSFPASTSAINVFTTAERQGDFSQLLSQEHIQLYNPYDIVNGKRQPFPNNQIPISMIDPVAQKLFSSSEYPQAVSNQLRNNAYNTKASSTNLDQGDFKIDYNISEKDRLFGRFSQSRMDTPEVDSVPVISPGFGTYPTHNGVLNWTRTISPSFVNEVRVGVNYVLVHNGTGAGTLGNFAESIGIQNGNDRGPGLMALNFSGGVVGNIGTANNEQMFADTVGQIQDAVIITKGRHVLHTGFQFMRERINTFYAGNWGKFGYMNYSGRFTAGPGPLSAAGAGSGAGEGDFFLGLPDDIGRGVSHGTWGQRSSVISVYLQDDWRVRNDLTLNLGLRYETHTPWVEVKDRQANFGMYSGSVEFAGQSTMYGDNRALYNPHNWGIGNFQPRIGFAWTPRALGGKTAFRGAYTISSYLEGTGTNLRLTLNPPLNVEYQTQYKNTPLPGSTAQQGLTVLTSPTDPFSGAVIRLWDPNVMPAIVQQWNFTVQRQLSNELTLQAGYVGQHGTHLMVPMPYLQRQLNPDGTTTRSPYLAGNPALANIGNISGTASNGNQRYDALQGVLQKRFSSGLQAQVAYTYSKCMTNSSGYYGSWGGQTTPTSPYWQNLYDMRSEWGPCYYDVQQVVSSYAVYALPVGHGKKLGSNMNKVANAVVGNWELSGIFQAHGGFPLTISGGDVSGTNSRGARANCLSPSTIFGKQNYSGGGYQWFDASAAVYGPAVPGTFGTCGVGTVRGPGLTSLDLSVQKAFAFTETKRLQFRSDFVNALNHPILNSPSASLGGGLGVVNSSQGERNIQLALKFYF